MANFSLRAKLYMLSGFLLSVSLVLGAVSYWSSGSIVDEYSHIAHENLPNIKNILQMVLTVRQARVEIGLLGLHGTTTEQDEASLKEVENQWTRFEEFHKAYVAVEFAPGEDELYQAMMKELKTLREFMDRAVALYHKGADEDAPERAEMRKLILGEIRSKGGDFRDAANRLRDFHIKAADDKVQAATKAANMGQILSVLTLAIGLLTGLAFAYLFSTSLVKTLSRITNAISEASTQVSSAASQIASSSEELSQAATEQASSLEETAASIEELNSMVNKNRENAKDTSTVSTGSEETATKGRETVEQMIVSMGEINRSNEQIGEIVKVINEIGSKTKVINDIVFQTKLLSFNASVEAARAGEHGKGFAVVAEEVGNLAAMSGNAAKEISSLLESSIQKVETIVSETKTKVEHGTHTAQECGSILGEIVTNVSKVASMAGEISTASEEQSRGVQEITKAMNQLDQVTQTNAATSEEAASAAEELSAQAEALRSLVQDLTFTVNGRADDAAGLQAAPVTAVSRATPAQTRAASAPGDKKGKLVHLKNRSGGAAAPAPTLKRAAGDDGAPAYDDSRFKDV